MCARVLTTMLVALSVEMRHCVSILVERLSANKASPEGTLRSRQSVRVTSQRAIRYVTVLPYYYCNAIFLAAGSLPCSRRRQGVSF